MAGLQLRKGCVGTGNQDRKDTSLPTQASRSKRKSGAWLYSEAQGLIPTVDKGSHPSDYYFSLVERKKRVMHRRAYLMSQGRN